jgi:hypothetical protein
MADQGQLPLDFDYDDRSERLAREVALMIVPFLAPGTKTETVKSLASKVAMVATRTFKDVGEPAEAIRCHLCDADTFPKTRVRIAVCPRCSMEPRSPGSSG